jgi:chromosome segregation ATPase
MNLPIELIGTAMVALLGAIVILARALSNSIKVNISVHEVVTKQNESLIALNNELQEHSKDRQAWQLERVRFEAKITAIQAASNEACERFERQTVGLNAQLAQERTKGKRLQESVAELAKKVEHLEAENETLKRKVAALEQENTTLRNERAELIEKVDKLQTQLDAECTSNNELRAALDTVRSRMKDLPKTDDLTDAAAKVAGAQTPDDDKPDPPPSGPASQPLEGGKNKDDKEKAA